MNTLVQDSGALSVFLEDGQLLQGVARIRNIPATIVQGRFDIVL